VSRSVAKIGSGDRQRAMIKFPNFMIFSRLMQAPTGGSIGTTVNHLGFSVPDVRPLVSKIKANGFKIITADSVAANVKVADGIAARPATNLAFALGPEDVKVEFVEVKSQKAPIQLHVTSISSGRRTPRCKLAVSRHKLPCVGSSV
jgi:hypothetical protein